MKGQGKVKEAMKVLKEVADLRKIELGEDDPDTLETLAALNS
jgi:hypothetical protein